MEKRLIRKDPFWQELLDFRQSFDEIVNRFFSQPFGQAMNTQSWVPAMDCYIEGGKYHVQVALPGVDPKQLNVQVHGNLLTVSGEHSDKKEIARENYLSREFAYGHFERTVTLPEGVLGDKFEAAFSDGILHLTAPISDKALPRTIEVKALGEGTKNKSIAA
ncbi:MAG TPA: Hsp20/alpha crystallin family protein [Terriglobales bacterium]|nr:Hsp20/alpha crystallin family protein [Terriglobales bacterium]